MAKLKFTPPVKNGERVELTVETMASSGDGLCRYRGYAIFVPQGVTGDRVLAEIIKITPRFGVSQIVGMLAPSPERAAPPCAVFPRCGGCKLQHLPYSGQLAFKAQVVRDDLQRIGKLAVPEKTGLFPADPPFFCRNKASFAVQKRFDGLRLGFYRADSHIVEDSARCDALYPAINTAKELARAWLLRRRVSIYDERTHRGFLRGLIIRHSLATGETLAGLVTTHGEWDAGCVEELAACLNAAGLNLQGIVQNINAAQTNVILGGGNRLLWGRNYFFEETGGLRLRLSLPSFFQVNTAQAEKLYAQIRAWLPAPGLVIDAYCGAGAIGLWMAKAGHRVVGIEEIPEATADAAENARLNGLANCSYLTGAVEEHLAAIGRRERVAALIVDPPRKGCSETVLRAIPEAQPERIIYISCNPATLARDLAIICPQGYDIAALCAVDMFPQTQHVETAALLTRR